MNICVFCGSASGENPVFAEAAKAFGRAMAEASCGLVFGGGKVGLMGIIADAVLAHDGEAIGVIPEFLMHREVGHRYLTRLEVVTSMHERKKRMADLSDAFVAMPGGWGTLDELAEILTWRQLGLVNKPIGILNINNFFDPLLEQMRTMVTAGFLSAESFNLLVIETTEKELLRRLIPQRG